MSLTRITTIIVVFIVLVLQLFIGYNLSMSTGMFFVFSFITFMVVNLCVSLFLRYNLHWVVEEWWGSLRRVISRGLRGLIRHR